MGGFRKSVAVVVGVDAYGGAIPALRTAVADARAVAQLLESQHGYEVTLLVDQGATRDALLRLLEARMAAELGPDDRFLFYFAGHGIALDGDDGPEGFLLPVDAASGADPQATFVPMGRLGAAVRAYPCRHRLLLLDCCFAGSFRWSGHRNFAPQTGTLYRHRYERFIEDPAAQVLVSAAADQKALDLVDGLALGRRDEGALDEGHSPFAGAVLAGLAGAADQPGPDDLPDGVVTATELYAYVRDQVELLAQRRGLRQTPLLLQLPEHGRGEYVFQVPGCEPRLVEDPRLDAQANPWRGLSAYGVDDQAVFFGREAPVASLLARLTQSEPLLLVVGASGTGKSSLVQAGVLPRLGEGWTVVGPYRPGASPLEVLATVRRQVAAASGEVLAVVDQFEEVFTLGLTAQARAAFLSGLETLLAGGTRVLVTIRADFAGQLEGTPIGHRVGRARYVIPPIGRADLRAIIERPAALRVLFFEPPDLPPTLVDEVIAVPGSLPLLSFALAEMYLRYVERDAGDRALRLEDYEALGRIEGSLRSRAEALYQGFDAAAQASMRRLMLRAVSVEVGELARRRVLDDELRHPSAAEAERLARVRDALVEARLMVRDETDTGRRYVEPAHDTLILGWQRVYEWLHAAAETLPLHRALGRAAQDWAGGGPDGSASLLWDADPRLEQAAQLGDALNVAEADFVTASLRRRRTRRWVRWAAGLAALAVAAGLVFAVARQRSASRRAAIEAAERRDATLTTLARSWAADDPARAVRAVSEIRRATEANGAPQVLHELAVATKLGNPRIPDLDGAQQCVTLGRREPSLLGPGFGAAWAGASLCVDSAGALRWVAPGRDARRVGPPALRVTALAARAGEALFGQANGALAVWAEGDALPRPLLPRHDSVVHQVEVAADRRALSVSVDGQARVWDLAEGRVLREVGRRDRPVLLATLGERGRTLAWTSWGAAVQVATVAGGETGEQGGDRALDAKAAVNALAISPDETRLAAAGADGQVRLWDLSAASGGPKTLEGPGGEVLAVALGAGGHLALGTAAGLVEIWDPELTRPLVGSHQGSVRAVEFDPGGRFVVSGGADGVVRIWKADTGTLWQQLVGPRIPVDGVRFSADGASVVAHTERRTVHSWLVDPVGLRHALDAREPKCLEVHDLRLYVADDLAAAQQAFDACRARKRWLGLR